MKYENNLKDGNAVSENLLESIAGGQYRLDRISKEDASIILEAQKQTKNNDLKVIVNSNTGIFYKVTEV